MYLSKHVLQYLCAFILLYLSAYLPQYIYDSVNLYLSTFLPQYICTSLNLYLSISVPQYFSTSVLLYLFIKYLSSVYHEYLSTQYSVLIEQVPGPWPWQGPCLAVRPHDDRRLGVVGRVTRVGGAPPQGLDPPGGAGGSVAGLHLAPTILGVVVASGHLSCSHYCSQSG